MIIDGDGNCHVYVDDARRPRRGAAHRGEREDEPHERVQRGRVARRARGGRRRVPARASPTRSSRRASSSSATTAREPRPGDGRRHRRRLRPRVPRPEADGRGRAVARRRDRPREPVRHRAHRGDRHHRPRARAAVHQRGRRRGRDRERVDPLHRRRASSASAPRSASPPRSCTRVARWACASSPRTSTSCGATARSSNESSSERPEPSEPREPGFVAKRANSGGAIRVGRRGRRAACASVDYLADANIAGVVFLADRLEKPVLVEGPAGVGKTELAKAIAAVTGARLIRLQCYEGLDEAKALYEWNYKKQLLRIQADREHETRLGRRRGRHLLRAVPAHPAAARGDPGRGAGRAAHRRGRPGRDRDRGAAARGALRLPGVDPRARHDRRAGSARS